MFGIAVKVKQKFNTYIWKLMCPKNKGPYMFTTYDKAYTNMKLSYPKAIVPDEVRVEKL